MTEFSRALVNAASRLLAQDEREAVLGDFVEAGETAWRGLADVAGLVIRRQMEIWKSWRPWLAALGVAYPCSLPLMGLSVAISWKYHNFVSLGGQELAGLTIGAGALLVCQILLLAGLSWASGFVIGAISRRTLWASILASCLPCTFCLSRFKDQPLSKFCLLLFLLPAVWGVYRGLRTIRIRLKPAILLAVSVTLLMIFTHNSAGLWIFNLALFWPPWFLVVTARKAAEEAI